MWLAGEWLPWSEPGRVHPFADADDEQVVEDLDATYTWCVCCGVFFAETGTVKETDRQTEWRKRVCRVGV